MVTTQSSGSWIGFPKPNPQGLLRLFCFPYAGGSASIFRTWPNTLLSEIEVCPIHLPGREKRLKEEPFTELVPFVRVLAQAIYPYLDKPFAFFGHSMGTLISFELARELRRLNAPSPVHLFASGRAAPQISNPGPPIHELSELAFIAALRCYNGTPEVVLQNPELMQLLLPVLRADFALCETYVYSAEEPLDCSISAFGGFQDNHTSFEYLAGWQNQTCRSFKLHMFPGNHFFLHSAKMLLLQSISEELKLFLGQITELKHKCLSC